VEVPVEVEKVVVEERIVEVPVEKIVYQDRAVPVDRIVEVERIVEKIVEKRVEVPVPYEVHVPYEKEVRVEVPVERIVYRDVPVPVQMSPERVVVKEIPVPVEVVKEVPVPVERVVYKEVLVPVQVGSRSETRQTGEGRVVGEGSPYRSTGGLTPDHRRVANFESHPGYSMRGSYQGDLYGSQVSRSGRRIGLGLVLERHDHLAERPIVVKDLVHGFSAAKSGKLQPGDVILMVDQSDLAGYDLDQVKSLTIGEEGSYCTLTLLRTGEKVQATLQRLAPDVDEHNAHAVSRLSGSSALSPGMGPSSHSPYQ
jgi:hypothetical protein